MWWLVSIVLLIASFINRDVSMLQASGIFAVAGSIDHLAYTKRK